MSESNTIALNQNYGVKTRMKRSVESNKESGTQLYDEVVNRLKEYLFNNSKNSRERSSYNNIETRINSIMSQLGEP